MHKFDKTHWRAAKLVLGYLKRRNKVGITYQGGKITKRSETVGYSDADLESERLDRESTSGYMLLQNDVAVSWRSKRQTKLAHSTQEAEYVDVSYATREAVWLRRLNTEITGIPIPPIRINIDNQEALSLAKDTIVGDRTKHIDVRYRYIRSMFSSEEVKLQYISTENTEADVMKRPLGMIKHVRRANRMGMKYLNYERTI